MKKLLILPLMLMISGILLSQNRTDKNESPYFFVQSEDAGLDHFPLLSTTAQVNITGPVANVTVTQVYKNDGQSPIEAIYVFPSSTRAAVYDMTMKVGERVIKAEINEKNKARKKYENAKKEGKRTSLLEQHRPNVFQMNVANILPGDKVEVILQYNEFLIPEEQIYTFTYPTVVGPRYTSKKHPAVNEAFVSNPYTESKKEPSYHFDISINLNAGIPIVTSASPSHNVDIYYTGENTATIGLKKGESKSGNRDFIFEYSTSASEVASGTMLYEHEDENFFLTVIEPPKNIKPSEILPREYIFVVDVSGSMRGFPLNTSKKLMTDLISGLKPSDNFNVMLFASSSKVFSNVSVSATIENIQKAIQFVSNSRGGGGTELLPALTRALALPCISENNSRSIVVITDGYVSVERETFELISDNLDNSNLFAFGIGSSVNRFLIEGMAHMGRGEAFIVTDPQYAHQEAKRLRKYIDRPSLSNIEIAFEGIEAYDIIPKFIPDLMAERPIYVFGKYKGNAEGSITLTGDLAQEQYKRNIEIKPEMVDKTNNSIRYLWAREKIRWNQDFNKLLTSKDHIEKITNLGLKYNLLTDYTSFVAVDEQHQIANASDTRTVKQVLPTPQNVSNYAIGFELNSEAIVENKKNNTKSASLFVNINTPLDKVLKENITRALKAGLSDIKREDKKRFYLNTLTLECKATGVIDIKDSKNMLTETLKRNILKALEGLKVTQNVNIKIDLLWL